MRKTEHLISTTVNILQQLHCCVIALRFSYFSNYFNDGVAGTNAAGLNNGQVLRYGENPHQKATFYKFKNTQKGTSLAEAKILQGKELSYNNLLDADAAWKVASDAYHAVNHLSAKVAVAVVKHLNPCGLAVTDNIVRWNWHGPVTRSVL